jgi:Flp pilus assembly protein TadG
MRIALSFSGLDALRRDREGSALMEGAIVLPVLLTLGLGVFEFSWLFYQQHLISTGVSDAARYIARSSTPNDLTIQMNAKNLATTGAFNGGGPRVSGWRASELSITYTSVDNAPGATGLTPYRGGSVIESVTVSTTFTVPSLGFFGFLGLKPPIFTVSHQERVIGSD